MSVQAEHHDTADLLNAEHAVARVLSEADDEAAARPLLLEAIGEALGWEVGGLWNVEGAVMRCVETWHAPDWFAEETRRLEFAPGQGLPGRMWASGRPAWIADVEADPNFPRAKIAVRAGLRTAFGFPITGSSGVLGAIEYLAGERRNLTAAELLAGGRREPGAGLLATMASLGARIGQSVERWRAEDRLRESDARKSAILEGAFDSIITMDADGLVVEVNQATERMFGYTKAEMEGEELAELIIPPDLRDAHRRGVEHYVATGEATMVGHPVELPAMRADGSEFPVEIAITQPALDGRAQFTGFIRDATERKRDEEALRSLAAEQAALRRVATAVASEQDPERVFAIVTEEVGRLLGAHTANIVRFEPDGTGTVTGAWSIAGARAVPVGTFSPLDSPTVAGLIKHSGRPERVDSFEGMTGRTAEMLRAIGLHGGVGAPINLGRRLWGAMVASSTAAGPFPPGAEQRVADFADLVAIALGNAEAREKLAASRARIVEAGDAERRRLERNLHDGAQQRLVALALTLRLCEARVAGVAEPEARELLGRANAELAEALEELRELARGIHPAVLTDRGLVAALEMLAARPGIPVELSVELEERLPSPVEAAAYYIVAEALTNASRHARATHVRVNVSYADGAALVEVADDGVGGADERRGSGLRGLDDRVEALGGTLELDSLAGAGTTLRARIPSHT
jgi:PAS domain S-box-containing protein